MIGVPLDPTNATAGTQAVIGKRLLVAVVSPTIGLGNRMLSIISAFLVALLSRRAMLIYWQPHVPPQLDELFALPPGLQWDYIQALQTKFDPQEVAANSEAVEFFDSWPRQHTLSLLACGDLERAWKAPVVQLYTNQNIINILRENPFYQARLARVFGNDVFGPIARFLLRPAPSVAVHLAPLLASARPTLAVHLRLGRSGKMPAQGTVRPLIRDCDAVQRCTCFRTLLSVRRNVCMCACVRVCVCVCVCVCV
jgi:hypothetical protein